LSERIEAAFGTGQIQPEEDLFPYIITFSKGLNHPHRVAHFAILEEDLFPFPLCEIDGPGRLIMITLRGRSEMNLSDEQADHHKPEAHGSDADQMEQVSFSCSSQD